MPSYIQPSLPRHVYIDTLKSQVPSQLRETVKADPEFKNAPASAKKGGPPPLAGTAKAMAEGYTCRTQQPLSIFDHLTDVGNELVRWPRGHVINYAALRTGYPSPDDALFAAYQMAAAVIEWNTRRVGVTFNWVSDIDDAAFVLQYGGRNGAALASAFLPNDKPLNSVFVYSLAFDPEYKAVMKNVFLHELGHVLGLRHEFSREDETPLRLERFGKVNSMSVMGYNLVPVIQETDVADANKLYTCPEGIPIQGMVIRSSDPNY